METDHQGDKIVWYKLHAELKKSGYLVGDIVWQADFHGDFNSVYIPILGIQ